MNRCPRIEVDIKKIEHNTKVLVDLCENIQIAGVTKVFCGHEEIAKAIVRGGVNFLADARIENLKKLENINIPKILLRLPMNSQVKEVVTYSDISLNSEIKTIKNLSKEAIKQNKKHKIILMIDLGDLREGIWGDPIDTIKEIKDLEGIEIIGVGTNLTCYGGVIPSEENLGRLIKIREEIEERFNISLSILSGGNSSSLYLIEKGRMPSKINHLRLGEAIVLGRETAYGDKIENTYEDAFTFVAEIIELKEKPSVPIGEIGMDAFGNKPIFEDNGIRKRAILAVGRQDVQTENIIPIDENMKILGASSDHLILDITDAKDKYEAGDEVRFKLSYGGILQLMTSSYINKIIQL
ncbi:ornithine racemase Orr [Inediibacterium massiliense]|uniref:ornithine racemase Orr n=1 Tax=Inediibacterium massiliense TaxID=1658111 RepID=UPI0006B68240|nr:ornithine racemase Orr [Inediibacterium massiliense]